MQENDVINLEERRQARLATGGKGPPGNRGGNWISSLPQGTHFIARRIGGVGSELDDFIVATSNPALPAVLLARNAGGIGDMRWHDPDIFSKHYQLYMILENVNDTQSILPERMASDDEPEDID